MRVLITGGMGYLGGRIAVELSRDPNIMVLLGSRKAQSAPDWFPQAETVVTDVVDPKSIAGAIREVQAVVHLAAMNENECVADPGKSILINTLGTMNILQAAINAGVERFIYFSTAHVYGDPLRGCITEKTLPRPIHPYAITHHASEDFVLAAHDQNKISGIVIRLSNGFGVPTNPNVNRWTLLVNDLCRQAVTTRKLVLRSAGFQKRDFVTLLDVSRAVSHFLSLPVDQCDNGLFNLGGECSLRIIDMAELIAKRCYEVLGFKTEIIRPEPIAHEPSTMLEYSIEKLKSTGFVLNKNMNAEIDATLLFCKNEFGQKA